MKRRWLTLHHWHGVGSAWGHYLYQRLAHFDDFQQIPTNYLQQIGLPNLLIENWQRLKWSDVDQDLAWHQPPNQQILCCTDSDYPALLATIPYPPPILFIRGNLRWLKSPQLAIVGSRQPSPYGNLHTQQLATALAKSGLTITSGLAQGIDGTSHGAALAVGQGTVAVLGSGVNHIYPYRHRRLAHQITEHGCLVSTYSPNCSPKAHHFPQRNRIISGLSLGVLVIEARQRSGALITAHHAVDQGRDVFALPGAINNPLSRGCHDLIQQGAKLVTQPNDIFSELSPLVCYAQPNVDVNTNNLQYRSKKMALDQASYELLASIGYEPVTIDQICLRSKRPANQVMSELTRLTINGMIQQFGDYYLRVCP